VSLLALFGYWTGLGQLYRPISNGPATNPLTAVCFLMTGCYILTDMSKYRVHPLKPFFLVVVLSAVLLKIIDHLAGSNITEDLSPFYYEVMSDIHYGLSNTMGINTSLMFFVITLSLVSKALKKFILSQSLSIIAFIIPCIATLGYLLKLDRLYGQMSLLTAILGILMALSVYASLSGHGFSGSNRRAHKPE
jgi:hypothetical protein